MNTDQDVQILIWAESLLSDVVLLYSVHDNVRHPPTALSVFGTIEMWNG